MNLPPAARTVNLIDGRSPDRQYVTAQVYRDCPVETLERVETDWADARRRVAGESASEVEHSHWDWRNKTAAVASGESRLLVVGCEGHLQGVMSVSRDGRPARLSPGLIVYVDFLEVAPWNLRSGTAPPRFAGVGSILIAEAVLLSVDLGMGGKVGLHSLPQSEAFYERCSMPAVGPDPGYAQLTYFEYNVKQARDFLAATEKYR
jgi:hypothetical protein